jgi:hypothetical protein
LNVRGERAAVAFWRKRDDDFGAVAVRFASPVEQAEPAQSQMLGDAASELTTVLAPACAPA